MTVATAQDAELGMMWLAGYPRSGAALIRTILLNCFGHWTASYYAEAHIGEAYAASVGLVNPPATDEDVVAIAAHQPLLTVKTHELPDHVPNQMPVLVIVRDGRRTLESLKAFYLERNGLEHTMTDLIMGAHRWGTGRRGIGHGPGLPAGSAGYATRT